MSQDWHTCPEIKEISPLHKLFLRNDSLSHIAAHPWPVWHDDVWPGVCKQHHSTTCWSQMRGRVWDDDMQTFWRAAQSSLLEPPSLINSSCHCYLVSMYLCATAVLQNKTDQHREQQRYNTQINKATTRRTHTDLLVHITLLPVSTRACCLLWCSICQATMLSTWE